MDRNEVARRDRLATAHIEGQHDYVYGERDGYREGCPLCEVEVVEGDRPHPLDQG